MPSDWEQRGTSEVRLEDGILSQEPTPTMKVNGAARAHGGSASLIRSLPCSLHVSDILADAQHQVWHLCMRARDSPSHISHVTGDRLLISHRHSSQDTGHIDRTHRDTTPRDTHPALCTHHYSLHLGLSVDCTTSSHPQPECIICAYFSAALRPDKEQSQRGIAYWPKCYCIVCASS